MSEAENASATGSIRRAIFNLTGIGTVILGIAALSFAAAFADKQFTSDTSFPKTLGYEIVAFDGQSYLVDKENGRVWERKRGYSGSAWCLADIEGRRDNTLPSPSAPGPCR